MLGQAHASAVVARIGCRLVQPLHVARSLLLAAAASDANLHFLGCCGLLAALGTAGHALPFGADLDVLGVLPVRICLVPMLLWDRLFVGNTGVSGWYRLLEE